MIRLNKSFIQYLLMQISNKGFNLRSVVGMLGILLSVQTAVFAQVIHEPDSRVRYIDNRRVVLRPDYYNNGSSESIGEYIINTGMNAAGPWGIGLYTSHQLTMRIGSEHGGRVGIGTDTPLSKLHVNGGARVEYIDNGRLVFRANNDLRETALLKEYIENTHGQNSEINGHGIGFHVQERKPLTIGKEIVRIGTATHSANLSVAGDAQVRWIDNKRIVIRPNYSTTATGNIGEYIENTGTAPGGPWGIGFSVTGQRVFHVQKDKLSVGSDSVTTHLNVHGRLYIGVQQSQIKQSLLSKYSVFAQHGVLSEDFALAPVASWADHVLAKDYKLQSLDEVEAHISLHGHLPNIPSEAELKENGYSVHDMNVRMMSKIEELTLYSIGQQKEINSLKAQLARYEALAGEVQALKASMTDRK